MKLWKPTRSKAYAPRKMRDNIKPTQCMKPACVDCTKARSFENNRNTPVAHDDEPCPLEAADGV